MRTVRQLTHSALGGRFSKARKYAEVAPAAFQFRDLRVKAATEVEGRNGMESAQSLLGHADTSMTKNYVRNRIGKLVKPTA